MRPWTQTPGWQEKAKKKECSWASNLRYSVTYFSTTLTLILQINLVPAISFFTPMFPSSELEWKGSTSSNTTDILTRRDICQGPGRWALCLRPVVEGAPISSWTLFSYDLAPYFLLVLLGGGGVRKLLFSHLITMSLMVTMVSACESQAGHSLPLPDWTKCGSRPSRPGPQCQESDFLWKTSFLLQKPYAFIFKISYSQMFFVVLFLFSWDRFSLCSSGWPQIHDCAVWASGVLGLQACTTRSRLGMLFIIWKNLNELNIYLRD